MIIGFLRRFPSILWWKTIETHGFLLVFDGFWLENHQKSGSETRRPRLAHLAVARELRLAQAVQHGLLPQHGQ